MKKNLLIATLSVLVLILFFACNQNTEKSSKEESNSNKQLTYKELQTKLIKAKDGDTIFIPEGEYHFKKSLSLDATNNITIKGAGIDKTLLNFEGQDEGAEGIKVTNVKNILISDLAVQNTKGDGIKVQESDGIILRRLSVEWTNGPDSTNGSYGIYPVNSKNILMEDCIARGASDAGVYVGQSMNAILRNNLVEQNVAGVEVENSLNTEVYGNTVQKNTAGIMVFDLPELPKKNGRETLVYDNKIINNNQPNFSPKGISVYMVPAGVGLVFMACQRVEAHSNYVAGNKTLASIIVSLNQMGRTTEDSLFDIYPSSVYLHDNTFENNGGAPDTTRPIGRELNAAFGGNTPSILFEGIYNPALLVDGELPAEHRVCIQEAESTSFFNMNSKSSDISEVDCQIEPVSRVKFTNSDMPTI